MGKVVKPLAAVATGGLSLAAPAVAKKLGLSLDDEQGEFATPEEAYKRAYQKAAADYTSGMSEAEKGVQTSALTKDLYGEGGLQSRLNDEERRLASTGFQLTPEDRSAYGQASGDISRLFGQQEQDAARSLARRGLGSASSGAANALYSGLAGNKNEMLAKAQADIAQKRMADNRARVNETRNLLLSMGTEGSQLARQRYSDRLGGLAGAAGAETAIYDQNRQMLADKQDAVKPGLFSTIGQGLQAGIGNLATQAPGMGLGAATGGQYGTASLQQTQDAKAKSRSMFG